MADIFTSGCRGHSTCCIIRAASFLAETMKNVVTLPSALSLVESNNGKLVHLSGVIYTDEPFVVNEYGIAVSAVKLKHRVQMYQWVQEHRSEYEDGGNDNITTHYIYFTDWKDKLINSSLFFIRPGHENPRKLPRKTKVFISERVTIGKFSLSSALKQKFNNFVIFTSDERPEQRHIKLHSGLYYHCHDVWHPEVGDIRIQFSYAGMAGEYVTILAKQVGVELQPFELPTGEVIAEIRPGSWSIKEMFHQDHSAQWGLRWTYRALGWLCVFLGTNCSSTFLYLLVCRYSNRTTPATSCLTSMKLTFSVSLSLFVISMSWLWYKPILGLTIFVAAVSPAIYVIFKYNLSETQKLL
ncbi:transmembrane protein 43 homolog isoform X2 [Bacillus rossius redtenbacheri]|uniref:transmembrane protein 43 homolog isoform X2 n=1 Tax=Bacillus rossius redtenbacheri TaxID=93214 RepID=UPI002FDEFE1D